MNLRDSISFIEILLTDIANYPQDYDDLLLNDDPDWDRLIDKYTLPLFD